MHRRSGLAASVVALSVIVAGCGGGSQNSSTLPGGSSSSGQARTPQLNGGTGTLALPTLYVAGQGAVFAYNLPRVGTSPTPDPNQAPVSQAGGYYYNSGNLNATIAGIATNRSGDLVVVQNFMSPQGNGNSCQLAYVPARTGTSASNVSTRNCGNPRIPNTPGSAVGVSFTGGPPSGGPPPTPTPMGNIDVLMHYLPSGNRADVGCQQPTPTPVPTATPVPTPTPSIMPTASPVPTASPTPFPPTPQYQVDRYTATNGNIQPNTCFTLNQGTTATYKAIAGTTNGAFFVDYTTGNNDDSIEEYNSRGQFFSGGPSSGGYLPGIGALAVGGTNGQYQIVASTAGGVTTIYSFNAQPFGPVTFTHALGSFPNPVSAIAVDNSGNIYVGINQPNGVTKVKVYGPTKTEATQPDYILNNPVRRPNPAASPAAKITGIAIAQ